MNEEYSYIFYTFFKNLQEMKEKPPWCLFEVYHTYDLNFWDGLEMEHRNPYNQMNNATTVDYMDKLNKFM